MSSECILENVCSQGCPCKQGEHFTHLNVIRKSNNEVKYVNIRGRFEHEALIKDKDWCKELGLDQEYEIAAYLRRWGSWLSE